jgi:4-amino-4-deoxy-L-arabinose transferase-like glycosyltransferase
MNTLNRKWAGRLLLLALILLYWFSRLHNLSALGFFLDEAAHTDWARLVWKLQPFHAASDGKLLNVLWIAAFWPFNSGVWVARASGLFVTTSGFACLLAIAHQNFSQRAAVITGLLYIFFPLSFFFERMALADPLSAAFVAGAVWTMLRACKVTNSTFWSVLCGIALAAALLSKLTNLVFLCLPILASLTLIPVSDWRRGLRVTATVYLAIGLALALPILGLKYLGHSDFGFDLIGTRTTDGFDLSAFIQTLSAFSQAYLPFPLWLVVSMGGAAALWKGKRAVYFVGSLLLVTLGLLIWQSGLGESRYLLVYAPLLGLLTAAGLARLVEKRPVWLVLIVLAITTLPGAIFMEAGWRQPESLALPGEDRWQYISGWPAGYGFKEIAAAVESHPTPLQLITLDVGGRQRLDGYLLGSSAQITARTYKPGLNFEAAWLLLDRPKDDGEIADLNLNLIEIARYPRPGNESAIVVYRVEP